MPVGDDVEIPDNIVVRCPLRGFALVRARNCNGCEHFRGLTEQMARAGIAFHRAYAARCAHPVDRELAVFEED